MPLSGSRVATLIPSASNPGVRNAIRRLEVQGLVTSRPAPPAVLYVANRRHLLWPAIDQLMRSVDGVHHALTDLIASIVQTELGADESHDTTVAVRFHGAR